ncbi:MAG: DUF3667 domain-containing protein [Caulobacteraceae bacterium]|nr:MAG: DUF3667 domain-containing protein [Caulobacteraceae bacterium]
MPLDTANERLCDDCGAPLVGRFCHACGEDSQPPRRALKDLLSDGLDNVFSFTEHVLPTLRDMAVDPGRVLRGLRDGNRKRYLSPFKLYLSATLVFFLFLGIAGVSLLQFQVVRTGGPLAVILDHEDVAEMKGFYVQPRTLERGHNVPRDEAVVKVLKAASANLPDEGSRAFIAATHLAVDRPSEINDDIATWAPRALWLLMPVYALLIWPLYARGAYVADHLIFSIWAHSTLFLLMILGAIINLLGLRFGLGFVLLAYQAYLTVGLKGYYGRSWAGAVLKGGLISAVYSLIWLAMSFAFIVGQASKFLPAGYFFSE